MPGCHEDPATSPLDSVQRSGSPPGTRRAPTVGVRKRYEVIFGGGNDGGRRKLLAFSLATEHDVILPDKD